MFTLTIDQSKVYKAICYFIEKYGQAYPSVSMIGKVAGMCSRKAADHIRELVELGRIRKLQRWENGRQLSNMYELVEEAPVEQEPAAEPSQEEIVEEVHADYKRSYKSSKKSFNKKDDDDYMQYRRAEFVSMAEQAGIPACAAEAILPEISDVLCKVSWIAIKEALHRMRKHAMTIGHFPSWFKSTLISADLALQMELRKFKTKSIPR